MGDGLIDEYDGDGGHSPRCERVTSGGTCTCGAEPHESWCDGSSGCGLPGCHRVLPSASSEGGDPA